ncbi:MAG: RsmE family RNA methyltransferase [Candidatus Dojkabacteria bacterium]|nr:MAG: RsmE family RNA methyltransferase [Candidatus Dojkabacteria bacterium]
MKKVYIPHKISTGDIANLSDRDSDILINQEDVALEDTVEVDSPSGSFLATVVFIDKATVEIEVMKQLSKEISQMPRSSHKITVMQAASNESKFNFFLEKAVELGATQILPIHSELCLLKFEKYQKKEGLWSKIVNDAVIQSRTTTPPQLERLQKLENLRLPQASSEIRIALSTEPMDTTSIYEYVNEKHSSSDFTIAIGPEKGWSAADIAKLRGLGFQFVNLKGNMLRTETPALMLISIIKYVQKAL